MEDVEFFRRLHDRGRIIYINKRITVSARRYEALGRTFDASVWINCNALSSASHIDARVDLPKALRCRRREDQCVG
jgi:hypothetical protein